jgi:hypothetical protein
MKIYDTRFYLGGDADRFIVWRMRLPAESIEKVREGLRLEDLLQDGVAVPLSVDMPLLVVSREVEAIAEEAQGSFNLL